MVLPIWELTEGTAYIFYCYLNANVLPQSYLSYLNEEELQVYYKYKVNFKKLEFLSGRMLTKMILSKYLKTRPESICFIKTRYGKLYLKDHFIYEKGKPLQFNISHCDKMIVCAITLNDEIGVDVEKVKDPILDLAEKFFSPGEREYIARYGPEERNKAAYKIWTLKEAYIKARGLGLSMALDSFDVTLLGKDIFLKCIEPKQGYYISVSIDKKEYNIPTEVMEINSLSELITY